MSVRKARRPRRSGRDLTPFIFLAMILIPALIVAALAIADPGAPRDLPAARQQVAPALPAG
jgi:biopolymer transport protein ExbD